MYEEKWILVIKYFGLLEFYYQYLKYYLFPGIPWVVFLFCEFILPNCFAFQKSVFAVLFQQLESRKENVFSSSLPYWEETDPGRTLWWKNCRKSSNPFLDTMGSVGEKFIWNAQPWEKLNLSSHLIKHKRINPQDKKP